MGCGCGKAKAKGYVRDSQGNKIYDNQTKERSSTLQRVKETIKTAWESTQPDQPTHIIKRINKK
tara:strand:+ start:31 stop:222 length:192 start_codon:yes stop_codon:yes gene_type:complete